MNTEEFTFDLPEEFIAKYPTSQRTQSRLLRLSKMDGEISHHVFPDLLDFLNPGDLLVMNNTRVMKARLYGKKASGGRVEILIERILGEHDVLAHIKASKSPKLNSEIFVGDAIAEMLGKEDHLYRLKFNKNVHELMVAEGHLPLPPYMAREDEELDEDRYQTVYADKIGAVAAPTAGLHFDDALLASLQSKGIQLEYLTLHVGAGTFQPVRVDNIFEHKMHSEYVEISNDLCEKIKKTKRDGGRIIAVGTTTVRSLETAALSGEIKAFQGDTDIFIYPGFDFKCIDVMITNFHLSASTLIMLVSAFSSLESIKKAYHEAIQKQYRFFSYGDAMLIE